MNELNPTTIARPTKLAALEAHIEKYVENGGAFLAALANKTTERLAPAYATFPAHRQTFELECKFRQDLFDEYEVGNENGNIYVGVALAIAAWVEESSRVKGQPDVECVVKAQGPEDIEVHLLVQYF